MKATVAPELISITPNFRESMNAHFLTVDVPNGWDDVKKISKKVLAFEGRYYTFTGWSSDSNQCWFRENSQVATITKLKTPKL